MADEPTQVVTPDDKPVEESKYNYKKHTKASMAAIAKEEKDERHRLRDAAKKLQEELNANEPPTEKAAAKETEPEDKAPERMEIDTAKIAEAAAEKAATKARADFEQDLKKIEDSKASEAKKEEKREELRAKWTGKDPQTGETTPKDWDELVTESRRLALEDFRQELAEKEAEQAKARDEQLAQEKVRDEHLKKINEENLAYVNRRVMEERERMYENRVLPRPKDPNDPNDAAVQRERALFAKALEVNQNRQKAGKEPITSIADIYYNYFLSEEKITKQPAGADAPISGSATTPQKQVEDRFSWSKDHHRSMREIALDVKRALKR